MAFLGKKKGLRQKTYRSQTRISERVARIQDWPLSAVYRHGRACSRVDRVAIVAGLDARVHDAVAAGRHVAARAARVGVDQVCIVALLAGLNEAVAAARGLAHARARVGVDRVAVVALLRAIRCAGIDVAIATAFPVEDLAGIQSKPEIEVSCRYLEELHGNWQ